MIVLDTKMELIKQQLQDLRQLCTSLRIALIEKDNSEYGKRSVSMFLQYCSYHGDDKVLMG